MSRTIWTNEGAHESTGNRTVWLNEGAFEEAAAAASVNITTTSLAELIAAASSAPKQQHNIPIFGMAAATALAAPTPTQRHATTIASLAEVLALAASTPTQKHATTIASLAEVLATGTPSASQVHQLVLQTAAEILIAGNATVPTTYQLSPQSLTELITSAAATVAMLYSAIVASLTVPSALGNASGAQSHLVAAQALTEAIALQIAATTVASNVTVQTAAELIVQQPQPWPGLALNGLTRLTHAGALAGAADSPLGVISVWVRATSSGGVAKEIFRSSTGCLRVYLSTGTNIVIELADLAGTKTLQYTTGLTFPFNTLDHFLIAYDTNHAAGQKLIKVYVNDVLDAGVIVDASTAFNVGVTDVNWSLGGTFTGETNDFTGTVADLFWQPGVYFNPDTPIRRRFLSSSLGRMPLGADGSIPFGSPPLVYLHGPSDRFGQNFGTGGDFGLAAGVRSDGVVPSVGQTNLSQRHAAIVAALAEVVDLSNVAIAYPVIATLIRTLDRLTRSAQGLSSTELAAASLTEALAAGNVAPTQISSVSVATLIELLVSGAVSAKQAHQLALQGLVEILSLPTAGAVGSQALLINSLAQIIGIQVPAMDQRHAMLSASLTEMLALAGSSLTQRQLVAANGMVSLLALDTLAALQSHKVTGASLTSALALGNGSLSQIHNVAANIATELMQSSETYLEPPTFNITITSLFETTALTTLTSNVALFAAGLVEALALQPAAGTLTFVVMPDGVVELGTLAGVSLLQAHAVQVDGAVEVTVFGLPTIGQDHSLVPGTATLVLAVPEGGLTQQQALAVASVVALMTLGELSALSAFDLLADTLMVGSALDEVGQGIVAVVLADNMVEALELGDAIPRPFPTFDVITPHRIGVGSGRRSILVGRRRLVVGG